MRFYRHFALAALSLCMLSTFFTPVSAQDIEQEVRQCRRQCHARCAGSYRACVSRPEANGMARCVAQRTACRTRCVQVECMT